MSRYFHLFFPTLFALALAIAPLPARAGEVPTAAKWNRVKQGTSQAELIKLLGEPFQQYREDFYFGPVLEKSDLFPSPISFVVTVRNGKVAYKLDPFDGDLSTSGSPTKPLLWLPQNKSEITHGLPYIDFRWRPASGVLPMSYELEIEQKSGAQWQSYVSKQECSLPYFALYHTGNAEFRWRVKARNPKGTGNWSPWATFSIVTE